VFDTAAQTTREMRRFLGPHVTDLCCGISCFSILRNAVAGIDKLCFLSAFECALCVSRFPIISCPRVSFHSMRFECPDCLLTVKTSSTLVSSQYTAILDLKRLTSERRSADVAQGRSYGLPGASSV
jgi:hypothetical protein